MDELAFKPASQSAGASPELDNRFRRFGANEPRHELGEEPLRSRVLFISMGADIKTHRSSLAGPE